MKSGACACRKARKEYFLPVYTNSALIGTHYSLPSIVVQHDSLASDSNYMKCKN